MPKNGTEKRNAIWAENSVVNNWVYFVIITAQTVPTLTLWYWQLFCTDMMQIK